MIRELETVDQVVSELGGSDAVRKITRSKYVSTVSNWIKDGKFPPKTYKVMQNKLCALGLSAPDRLWGMIHG